MRCVKCPLYSSWSNESDSGENCGLFGDSWDNALQYEDDVGNIKGCYVDRHFIEKVDREYDEHLAAMSESYEKWMIATEPPKEDE